MPASMPASMPTSPSPLPASICSNKSPGTQVALGFCRQDFAFCRDSQTPVVSCILLSGDLSICRRSRVPWAICSNGLKTVGLKWD